MTSVLPRRTPAAAPPEPPVPPRRPGPRSGLVTVLGTTVGGFFLCLLLLGGSTGLQVLDPVAPPRAGMAATPVSPAEERLLHRYDCVSGSLPADAVPGSALIREAGGRVHAVDFERAWQIYRRHDRRTLVAVCLRPVR